MVTSVGLSEPMYLHQLTKVNRCHTGHRSTNSEIDFFFLYFPSKIILVENPRACVEFCLRNSGPKDH